MTMDGLCCLGCGRPAAYTFKNLETDYKEELCNTHAKALDVRNPEKFLRIPTANDEATTKLKQEISDAYGRHHVQGRRIPMPDPLERSIERTLTRQPEKTIEPAPQREPPRRE